MPRWLACLLLALCVTACVRERVVRVVVPVTVPTCELTPPPKEPRWVFPSEGCPGEWELCADKAEALRLEAYLNAAAAWMVETFILCGPALRAEGASSSAASQPGSSSGSVTSADGQPGE